MTPRAIQLCANSRCGLGLKTGAYKVEARSDVENELDQLQRKLMIMIKTREIEALVAAEQDLGDLSSMESTQYARLRIHVEELIYKWQEAEVRPSTSNPDTAINRLIAEREDIEEQILTLEVR